jgi:dienelactone hydrolase
MRSWILLLSLGFVASAAQAAMVVKPVNYSVGDEEFAGHLVYDDANIQPRPGLVMVPSWMGVTDSAVEKAKQIAGTRYVVLVVDMYGKDVRPKDASEAKAQTGKLYAERGTLRKRIAGAVETLKAQAGDAPLIADKIGALGFCFGGTTVLELARSGSRLAGVVSLHGGLSTSMPATASSVKTPILVLNGAADRGISAEDITNFGSEMDAAGADWQFVNFSGAVHCFAEADAASPPGCVYDERAAKRAYRMLDNFFDEAFAAK